MAIGLNALVPGLESAPIPRNGEEIESVLCTFPLRASVRYHTRYFLVLDFNFSYYKNIRSLKKRLICLPVKTLAMFGSHKIVLLT